MFMPSRFRGRVLLATALWALASLPVGAAENSAPAVENEGSLLEILRSDAPSADKALTCKRLAICGSGEAVPYLAPLLEDAQLASWARIALEAIPGPEADRALRSSLGTLHGKLLVGAINSIGVRRDAGAVELLVACLGDRDAEVAAAAAVALGHIGDAAAAQALRSALTIEPSGVRDAAAEGCVLCAERLLASGSSPQAAELYDLVRGADVAKQRIVEATRGAILARNQGGIPLLLEQLRTADPVLFQLALTTAREFPGGELDKALADELARATPERAALMLQAMADRPATVVLPAVVQAAAAGPTLVRIAAIGALGRVGNDSSLSTLLAAANEADAELSQAAKSTLAVLPGESVDAQIVAGIHHAEGKQYALLVELVGNRRIRAMPELTKALENSDALVRAAALTALGETVAANELSVLTSQVVSPQHADDLDAAVQALQAASVRMPDRDACAAELALAMGQAASSSTKSALLKIIAAVGGATALQHVGAAGKSNDPQLQDVSSRLLGEWMTEDAAPVLLDLAVSVKEEKFQVRALRGYLRIVRQFVQDEGRRAEMCQQALQAAHHAAEKQLVLDILKRRANKQSLGVAMVAMNDAEIAEEAAAATLAIAQKLAAEDAGVFEQLSQAPFDRVKVEIVKGEYGAGTTIKDVTEVLRKLAGGRPLIAFADGYNATFGGDPLPGSAKELKVQYRINGKPGNATFPEDALVILQMPQ